MARSRVGEGRAVSIEAPVVSSPVESVADDPQPAVAPAHTDWLYHGLQIGGPAAQVSTFRKAAAAAGVIPWRLDLDRMEEDFFLRLAAPPPGHARTLSMDGARLLAAEVRDAVARRHALAVARVGQSSACPFDLHALLPVPAAILRLAPIIRMRWPGCGRIGAPRRPCATWRPKRIQNGVDPRRPVRRCSPSPSGRRTGRRGGRWRPCGSGGQRCASRSHPVTSWRDRARDPSRPGQRRKSG